MCTIYSLARVRHIVKDNRTNKTYHIPLIPLSESYMLRSEHLTRSLLSIPDKCPHLNFDDKTNKVILPSLEYKPQPTNSIVLNSSNYRLSSRAAKYA
jgi:hypothetical protein